MSFHDFYSKLVAEHPANSLFKALHKLSLLDDLKVMAAADDDDDGGGEPGPGWIVWGDAGTPPTPTFSAVGRA